MCISAKIFEYESEEDYEQEMELKKLYNKTSKIWDYYSGLPGIMAYQKD